MISARLKAGNPSGPFSRPSFLSVSFKNKRIIHRSSCVYVSIMAWEKYQRVFWLVVAIITQTASSQSASSVLLTSSTRASTSSASKAAQTHTISVGKVSIARLAQHRMGSQDATIAFLTKSREKINILRIVWRLRSMMLSVR